MSQLTLDAITQALAPAKDPILNISMTQLGLVKDITVQGDVVQLHYRLLSPFAQVQKTIRSNIESALTPLGATKVDIRWQLEIPARPITSEDPAPGVKNVILVMSGKGGVGKSTTAVNIAVALQLAGAKVGLLDADLYGPSIPTMLGISGHPSSGDGVAIDPLERFGVKLMSIGFLMEDDKTAVVWRGPMLHRALLQFLKDVKWDDLDYLILDLPPGTGDVALTLAQGIKSTGAVIVTTPQEVALQDVYKSVSMCQKLEVPVLGVVENMSFFIDPTGVKHEIFGAGGGAKIAEFAKSVLLGQVPMEPKVREGGDSGEPAVKSAPDTPAAKALVEVAANLAARVAQHHMTLAGGDVAPPAENAKRLKIVR